MVEKDATELDDTSISYTFARRPPFFSFGRQERTSGPEVDEAAKPTLTKAVLKEVYKHALGNEPGDKTSEQMLHDIRPRFGAENIQIEVVSLDPSDKTNSFIAAIKKDNFTAESRDRLMADAVEYLKTVENSGDREKLSKALVRARDINNLGYEAEKAFSDIIYKPEHSQVAQSVKEAQGRKKPWYKNIQEKLFGDKADRTESVSEGPKTLRSWLSDAPKHINLETAKAIIGLQNERSKANDQAVTNNTIEEWLSEVPNPSKAAGLKRHNSIGSDADFYTSRRSRANNVSKDHSVRRLGTLPLTRSDTAVSALSKSDQIPERSLSSLARTISAATVNEPGDERRNFQRGPRSRSIRSV